MSDHTLDFEVVGAGMDDEKFKISIIPKGDYRYFGLVFNFSDVDMNFVDDGIGVNYDLTVDFASNQVPEPVTPERQQEIQDFGQKLLTKFIEDTISAIQLGLDKTQHKQYNDECCSESCTGECHE